jgi:hypothetical protein
MGYLLAIFPETRRVVIDDVELDQETGEVIEVVDPGPHEVSLSGPRDFEPEKVRVTLEDTNILEPLEVRFEKKT